MPANCIDAACEAAVAQPGYIALRTPSLKWRPYPHALWASMLSGEVVNYHPAEGPKVNALTGYDGIADDHDHAAPRRWEPGKLVLAAWVFALGVSLWWFKRMWRKA